MDKELLYIWLNKTQGIGPILSGNFLNYFGNIIEVYNSDICDLVKIDGIGEKLAKTIEENKDLDESKRVLEKCNNLNIEIVTKGSINYPKQLSKEFKAPIVLYVKGKLKSFESIVAIIGLRRCNDYGKDVAVELAEYSSSKNIPINSGMAKGIDSYAHTVAV